MREVLQDILKHCPFERIKITGTDTLTKIEACDANKILLLNANLKTPIPEFKGEFGIPNLDVLSGLLEFANYRTDGAKFSVKRRIYKGQETVEQFNFADESGYGTSAFRCMTADLITGLADIKTIPWEFSFTPSKSKIAEFTRLASLYKSIGTVFAPSTKDGNLIFSFGDDGASTHNGSILFAENVGGELKSTQVPVFTTQIFLSLLKQAGDAEPLIRVSNRGLLSVEVETAYAHYRYIQRVATR